MLHASKGFISLRLSGVSNVTLENVSIKNVHNQSPFGSKVCGNYKDSFSWANTVPGFLGADMRGITVESCKDVTFKNVSVKNVKSSHGNAIGVDVMFHSFNVKGEVQVGTVRTIPSSRLPDDFDLIPQNVPKAVKFNLSQQASSTLKVVDK